MATNLDAAFFCARAVAKRMIPRGRGAIINTCSVMSMLGRPTTGPYTATKGALMMLTKAMCADWAGFGIRANGIAPGYFATELTAPLQADPAFNDWLCKRTPAGRWGQLPELAGAAIFLASDAASYVNGHLLYVDGGLTSVV
jgi:gluconate 5-dehydrogenase